jgi:protein subunit release factor B
MVRPEKLQELKNTMDEFGIKESDLEETFMTSGKKGGQKANRSSNAVYLLHRPTGISVKCTETRERELNRFLARRLLADKIREKLTGKSIRIEEMNKIRKQKARRRRRSSK